ncbi:MAG: biotin--[acetyl-CoA-carboxylase] ligase [bacterium]|nr:biotin--[acetyl-CoA-carboxylase] ligase [bacterium]
MKTQILKMLRMCKSYVSGQEMCEELGVSRTAIWKCMHQLKEEGYTIEAISNKGYCLMGSPNTITDYEVKSRLLSLGIIDELLYYEEIDSTNNKAKQLGNEGDQRQLLLLADVQTAGRGRRGRSWSNPKGTNIAMSYKLHPEIAPQNASRITLVAALALVETIRQVTGLEAKIKWPNDIVINGHKVCGILTEMSSESDFIHYVVVGIGINVNGEEFPEEIKEIATSLFLQGEEKVDRAAIVVGVIKAFEKYYKLFLETEDLTSMMDQYNSFLVHNGHQVKIINGTDTLDGVAEGINKKGSLLVRLSDGTLKEVISGEVSVRGIYGYV